MVKPLIEIKGLYNQFGKTFVHQDVNLTVNQGEILAIIGGSGSGKTTLLRNILMLLKPTKGTVKLFGRDVNTLSAEETHQLRRRYGMLFQHSALFSALTVLDNILFPMREFSSLNDTLLQELAYLKLALVGLPKEAGMKLPAELSGGMQRRAAAARAIAMDPELLFLDEPTTGLDPNSARRFDELILFLRQSLNLTIVMITHDIESLKRASDRVAFIGEGRIIQVAPLDELMKNKHPLIVDYFSQLIQTERSNNLGS
jgi:phospholipid/cholesterol/gamma-HCH transport system ATP-binding protein